MFSAAFRDNSPGECNAIFPVFVFGLGVVMAPPAEANEANSSFSTSFGDCVLTSATARAARAAAAQSTRETPHARTITLNASPQKSDHQKPSKPQFKQTEHPALSPRH